MLVNLNNITIPFSEFYISKEELDKLTDRLRALTPDTEEDYVDSECVRYEDARMFLLPKISKDIIFMSVCTQIVDVPKFYLLSDKGDQKLMLKEGMDTLIELTEKNLNLQFLDTQIPIDKDYLQDMIRQELGSKIQETPHEIIGAPADENRVDYYYRIILEKVYSINPFL